MKAIILAAGRGSRMKASTELKPKCLVELGGRTLLDWQTKALRAAGVSDITIVRGYRKEKFPSTGYQYFENPRWAETNMVASLFCASSLLEKEPCLISYSDIVYHSSIVTSLQSAAADISITYDERWQSLWGERFANPLEDAESFKSISGRLVSIGARPSSFEEIEGQYMGLLKITPQGWKQIARVLQSLSIERKDKLDMTSLLQELLNHDISVATSPIQGKWCEVDREEDLRLYQRKLEDPLWTHDWR